jgi:exodeoxyribonuclease V beta subunit
MNAFTRMPGGTELGSFYHRIMEELLDKWSMQAFDYKEWVLMEAKNFGLNEPQQFQFYHWVERMMNVPLFDDITISKLKKGQIIIEKPFFLSVKPYQVDALYELIRSNKLSTNMEIGTQEGQQSDIKKGLLANLEHSNNTISAGFLKGFIDLSFEHEDIYYILDYKTNFLQGNEAYSPDSLNEHMVRLSYDIQGHLYSLAIHKFLTAYKKNYAYQQHFGGYYYVFVRGLSADNHRQGIHFCRPSEQRIKEMEVILNGNY